MAVGGLNLGNIAAFFRAGAMSAGIGGALLDKQLIAANDMAGLAALAERFLDAVPRQGGAA
jgi:2-keto-3-deoxy-6-phosphogluconate aldolase